MKFQKVCDVASFERERILVSQFDTKSQNNSCFSTQLPPAYNILSTKKLIAKSKSLQSSGATSWTIRNYP